MNWEYMHLVTHPFAIVLPIVGAGVGLVGWARAATSWSGTGSSLC